MQRIDAFRWLAEVTNCLGARPPQMDIMEHRTIQKINYLFQGTSNRRSRQNDSNSEKW
jgi:hypothetical protein